MEEQETNVTVNQPAAPPPQEAPPAQPDDGDPSQPAEQPDDGEGE